MSSHREAPEISKDPVADSTDLYAFVSPDRPDTVTLIANYIPLQDPAGGPNFFEFGDDVGYRINISNDGGGPDIIYEFRFTTEVLNRDTFLYNTGQITSLSSPSFNRRQFYSVRKYTHNGSELLGSGLASPPCNIGPRSTPNYTSLAASAVHELGRGRKVFAGQRADGFYVDLGSIFDLLDLRPFQHLHLIPTADAAGVNTLAGMNVHTIALQVPISELVGNRALSGPLDKRASFGVWTTASRRSSQVYGDRQRGWDQHGSYRQVSRLGMPLINEAVIPMGRKDEWNRTRPEDDQSFLKYYQHPEIAKLLPVLYPGVFPNLAKLAAARADLVAILLTGIPAGIIPGFANYTGPRLQDMLRLNVAVPPAKKPSDLGILGGDLAGFPNGRRPADDVVAIELRAIAGATYPLVAPGYKPDGAAALLTDGTTAPPFLDSFPYLDTPHSGFEVKVAV